MLIVCQISAQQPANNVPRRVLRNIIYVLLAGSTIYYLYISWESIIIFDPSEITEKVESYRQPKDRSAATRLDVQHSTGKITSSFSLLSKAFSRLVARSLTAILKALLIQAF